MDQPRVDQLARHLAAGSSRRRALRVLAAGALGPLLGFAGEPAKAEACLRDGKVCKRGSQCCSGRCQGKQGKKKCRRVAGASICTIRDDVCAKPFDGSVVDCGVGPLACDCHVTAAGRAFCADSNQTGVGCETDVECVAAIGEGAACVHFRTGRCNNGVPLNACLRPCPDPI